MKDFDIFNPRAAADVFGKFMTDFKEEFPVDIRYSGDLLIIRAELPGIKKEDLSVEVDDGVLTIKAEKKDEKLDTSARVVRKEISHGIMQRAFTLGTLDPSDITASYIDGVLEITLKKNNEKFKKVTIQ